MVLVLWCPFDEIGGPWRHTRMDLPIINPTYRLLVSAFMIVGASASLESFSLEARLTGLVRVWGVAVSLEPIASKISRSPQARPAVRK